MGKEKKKDKDKKRKRDKEVDEAHKRAKAEKLVRIYLEESPLVSMSQSIYSMWWLSARAMHLGAILQS